MKNYTHTRMISSLIIMLIASCGNVLTLVIFKNPLAGFCWYHLFICLALPVLDNFVLQKRRLKDYFKLIGLKKPAGIYLVLAAGIGIISIAIIMITYFLSKNFLSGLVSFNFQVPIVIAGSVFTVVFNGPLEEIFWRGYIHTRCLSVRNRPAAMLLNGLFFVSFHVFIILSYVKAIATAWIIIGLIFLAGLLFEWLREKSSSVIPPVILHFLISVGYTIVFLLLYFT